MRTEEIHAWLQENLFDEVPIAISVISQNFQIVDANHRFRTVYGPWKGRPCYEVYKGRTERCPTLRPATMPSSPASRSSSISAACWTAIAPT